jgi:hypothetical protein
LLIFRLFIAGNPNVNEYLKAAARVAGGWRVANWYTLTVLCLIVIFVATGSIFAYAVGYRGGAISMLSYIILRPLFSAPGVALAYLAAALRQIAIRSRIQYDLPVFFLTAASGLAGVLFYFCNNFTRIGRP